MINYETLAHDNDDNVNAARSARLTLAERRALAPETTDYIPPSLRVCASEFRFSSFIILLLKRGWQRSSRIFLAAAELCQILFTYLQHLMCSFSLDGDNPRLVIHSRGMHVKLWLEIKYEASCAGSLLSQFILLLSNGICCTCVYITNIAWNPIDSYWLNITY